MKKPPPLREHQKKAPFVCTAAAPWNPRRKQVEHEYQGSSMTSEQALTRLTKAQRRV